MFKLCYLPPTRIPQPTNAKMSKTAFPLPPLKEETVACERCEAGAPKRSLAGTLFQCPDCGALEDANTLFEGGLERQKACVATVNLPVKLVIEKPDKDGKADEPITYDRYHSPKKWELARTYALPHGACSVRADWYSYHAAIDAAKAAIEAGEPLASFRIGDYVFVKTKEE